MAFVEVEFGHRELGSGIAVRRLFLAMLAQTCDLIAIRNLRRDDKLGLPDDTPFPLVTTRRRWVYARCGCRKTAGIGQRRWAELPITVVIVISRLWSRSREVPRHCRMDGLRTKRTGLPAAPTLSGLQGAEARA